MSENEVRVLLARATEDHPPGLDLLAGLPAVRAVGSRRVGSPVRALVALGVAAAVVVSVALLALPLGQPSAQAQIAAAVETTSRQSYRLHGTSGSTAFEGSFDSVRRVGVVSVIGGNRETRFIGDLIYVRDPGTSTWWVSSRDFGGLTNAPVAVAVIKLAALDPQFVLQRLRSGAHVREDGSASGDGWTGTRFSFSVLDTPETNPKAAGSEPLTGFLDVDDQDRVRRLQVDFGTTGQGNVMEFSDFGIPVTVTAPPADLVRQAPTEKDVGTTGKSPTPDTDTSPDPKPTVGND
jgi:hypothetical protein